MVEIALFNVNDFALLFGAFLSLALAVLLILRKPEGRIKKQYWLFLALFFFLGILHSIDTLFYWSTHIKASLSLISPNFFFLFGFVLFLQGPLLYWFTKAAIFRNFLLTKKDALHLLPAIIYPFYMYMIYFRFDTAYKLQYVADWSHVTSDPYFEGMIWAQRLTIFIYSLLCVYKLRQYVGHLKSTHSSLSKVDLQWLKLLLIGFLIISSWVIITLIETRFIRWNIDSFMGGMDIYLRLLYISALVVYLLKNSSGLAEIQVEHTIGPASVIEEPQQQLIEKLQLYMESAKPYLEPHITVERLATRLNVSPKLLSSTINNQLQKNFFELIGYYRIEEAKRKLADAELRDLPISEIMKICGFSSKSVFNQAFKKSLGVTPSHYRQQYLG